MAFFTSETDFGEDVAFFWPGYCDEDVGELGFVILMWWLVIGIRFRAHITSFRFFVSLCACILSPLCVCGYVGYGVLIADPQFGGDENVCELQVLILMWWLIAAVVVGSAMAMATAVASTSFTF